MVWSTAVILAAAASSPVGLGQYAVGMTLDEVKAVAMPSAGDEQIYLACASQTDRTLGSKLSQAEADVGQDRCSPAARTSVGGMPRALKIGESLYAQPTFYFRAGQLYEIASSFPSIKAQVILDSLVARYGPASTTTSSVGQTKAGASFTQTVTAWKIGDKRVEFSQPGTRLDNVFVLWTDVPAEAKAQAELRAREAAKSGL